MSGKKQAVAVGPRIMGRFLDAAGGAESLGQSIYDDYQRTRQLAIEKHGKDNAVEKRLHGYTKDILTKIVDIDRFHHDTGELDEVSDSDLAALLMEEAVEKITSNPLFATKMLKVIRDSQPGVFQQLVTTGEIPDSCEVIDISLDEIPDDLLALAGADIESEDLPDNLFDTGDDNDGEPELVGGEISWPA